ncbi:MAG TPA: hypothetical protein VK741_25775 [Acetobacteraceae bacterium]|jgi:hypothetical protein|nr:hypothetical protein [Acetobacteraceae bacterium]
MSEAGITAVVIRGRFSLAEYGELIALLRSIDARYPGRTFEIVAVDPHEHSLTHAERLLREAVPPQEDHRTEFTTHPGR